MLCSDLSSVSVNLGKYLRLPNELPVLHSFCCISYCNLPSSQLDSWLVRLFLTNCFLWFTFYLMCFQLQFMLPKSEEIYARSYCFSANFIYYLLVRGYNFDAGNWPQIHFQKEVSNNCSRTDFRVFPIFTEKTSRLLPFPYHVYLHSPVFVPLKMKVVKKQMSNIYYQNSNRWVIFVTFLLCKTNFCVPLYNWDVSPRLRHL